MEDKIDFISIKQRKKDFIQKKEIARPKLKAY